MKLHELKESVDSDARIIFIDDLVDELGKIIDKSYQARTGKPSLSQLPAAPATAPAAPTVTPESKRFEKLNNIFESIIDEAFTPQGRRNQVAANAQNTGITQSMSDLVAQNFIKQMNSPIFQDPAHIAEIQKFAQEVEKTYPRDKGRAALQNMGVWAWNTFQQARQQRAGRGLSNTTPAGAPTNAAPQSSPAPAPTVSPEAERQSKVGVREINKIIPTLRKRDLLSVKKNIDNTLAGRGATTTAATTAATSAPAAGNNAFGQMAGQLSGSNTKKSSTGGSTTTTPTGVVHTANQKTPPPSAPPASSPVDNTIRMPKGKVRAAREGGVTPEEQAKFDERVKQAMAAQSK